MKANGNSILRAMVAVAAALFVPVAAAQITFYEQEGLHGRTFNADRPIYDFAQFGFNDRASSAIVQHGEWEVCDDANFHGNCITLRAGQYTSLREFGMNNRISSARPIKGKPKYTYAPPPPAAPTYSYYQRHGETLYQADVVATRAVMGPPEQRCWVEQQQVVHSNAPNVPGAIIGGVLGGVLGHQIGSGRGNDVATAVGAVGGAAVGANVNRGSQTTTQEVRKCTTVQGSAQPAYWDVTYVFDGVEHRTQLNVPPGPTITVNDRGEPRM